jgi:hypothetical protein
MRSGGSDLCAFVNPTISHAHILKPKKCIHYGDWTHDLYKFNSILNPLENQFEIISNAVQSHDEPCIIMPKYGRLYPHSNSRQKKGRPPGNLHENSATCRWWGKSRTYSHFGPGGSPCHLNKHNKCLELVISRWRDVIHVRLFQNCASTLEITCFHHFDPLFETSRSRSIQDYTRFLALSPKCNFLHILCHFPPRYVNFSLGRHDTPRYLTLRFVWRGTFGLVIFCKTRDVANQDWPFLRTGPRCRLLPIFSSPEHVFCHHNSFNDTSIGGTGWDQVHNVKIHFLAMSLVEKFLKRKL